MRALRQTITLMALTAATVARADVARFAPGEELSFSVEYLSIRTGQARIIMGQPQGDVWPVICQAKTDGIGAVVNIQEHYVAYWDAEKKLARSTELAAVEASDRHRDLARFDRENGKATVKIHRKGRMSERVYDIPKDVQDLAGALLAIRQHSLQVGESLEVPVFTNSKTFTLRADVIGRDTVETPIGTFPAKKIRVRTGFEGKFATQRDSFLWVTDDSRHVPVKISSEFAVGSVVVTLNGYKEGNVIARR